MPIEKTLTLANGADTTFHVLRRIEGGFPAETLDAHIASYSSEAAYLNGAPYLWTDRYPVDAAALAAPLGASIEAWLIDQADGPFFGGASVPDGLQSIEVARARKWSQLKQARDAAEFGGFTWDGSTFDSNEVSQSRIQGAAQLATLAMLADEPFEVAWTLADDTVRVLSGADMLAVGRAMGIHIMTVHETGRALRAAVDAATTTTELEAIAWPI
jgi:hypothetical protein